MLIEAQDKALLAARAALNKHAEDVLVLDLRQLSTVADFFVVATAASSPQLGAIADEVERQLKPVGERVWHLEGLEQGPQPSGYPETFRWVLVDCGDVVVHVFTPPARMFYQLERLWGDAPQIPLDPAPSSTGAGKS